MVEQIYLIRHGETAWSLSGQHTGRTDLPLTEHGEQQARRVGQLLRPLRWSQVLASPLQRARRTCELAGLGEAMQLEPNLREWDYGQYEGLTNAQIKAQQADWDVFRDGCPGGESSEQMRVRADAVCARLRALSGSVAVFSHGHFLRALAVRWIELPLAHGRSFGLNAGAVSLLGYEHHSLQEPAIELWNLVPPCVV
ncbi:MAG TPA: histidine phosphatase family protein [Steroidobacteraceae bacterium]